MIDRVLIETTLRNAVASAAVDDLADLVGVLESARAAAWSRLMTPVVVAAVSDQAPTMLTAAELATRYHVPQSWAYEMARQGKLPCRRFGRYVRFNLVDVERALADSKISTLGTRKKVSSKGHLSGPATALLPGHDSEKRAGALHG